MSNQQQRGDTTPPLYISDAVRAMEFGRSKNQQPALSFFDKLEIASSAKTIERFIISRDKYEKLCAFRVETQQTCLRQDHYYDFPGNSILNGGMSLRIREDKGPDGKERVTLKFRERETEDTILYCFNPTEITQWENIQKNTIPFSVFEKTIIREALTKVKKVGFISTTRSLLFDGGVTIDNCFFQKGKQTFKDYEVRLKNEEYREDLYLLFKNQFLNIPLEKIEESRYQRLMSI